MKKILLTLMKCGKLIDKDRLHKKNGVYYKKNEETPYTGKAIGCYKNGEIKSKENYRDGIRDGKIISYYENEKNKNRGKYKDGEKTGEWINYYRNGKIKYKENFKDGKKTGEWISYYEN